MDFRHSFTDEINARDFRGISFLLSSIVFHIIPTALEVSMVCGILVCLQGVDPSSAADRESQYQSYKFGWDFAAVTALTMIAYSWFTIKTTAWRCVRACRLSYSKNIDGMSFQNSIQKGG